MQRAIGFVTVLVAAMFHVGVTMAAPIPAMVDVEIRLKELRLTWSPAFNAAEYRVYEKADGLSGFIRIHTTHSKPGIDVVFSKTLSVHKFDWTNAQYYVEGCDAMGSCSRSATLSMAGRSAEAVGYFKASNVGADDRFGGSVALSADGLVMAVGADGEDSGDVRSPTDNSAPDTGAVYIFTRSGPTAWSFTAYLKAPAGHWNDSFGSAVALDDDGNTLLVGTENGEAAYVFEIRIGVWTLTGVLGATTTADTRGFGKSVALSGDGRTAVVGAPIEASGATGIDGDEADDSAPGAGAAYVFTRPLGSSWRRTAYLKASNTDALDDFGASVAVSDDGSIVAVGADGEDGGSSTDENDDTLQDAGAVYVFAQVGGRWAQQARLKGSNIDADRWFGSAVALNAAGSTLAVGSSGESASAGAAYVFTGTKGLWTEQQRLSVFDAEADDRFGAAVALDHAGDTLVAGAYYLGFGEDGGDAGVEGSMLDNSAASSGAVYRFVRSDGQWTHQSYIKASNTEASDGFGGAVALDRAGGMVAVGASGEDSNAKRTGGGQGNNSVSSAGAVYLY